MDACARPDQRDKVDPGQRSTIVKRARSRRARHRSRYRRPWCRAGPSSGRRCCGGRGLENISDGGIVGGDVVSRPLSWWPRAPRMTTALSFGLRPGHPQADQEPGKAARMLDITSRPQAYRGQRQPRHGRTVVRSCSCSTSRPLDGPCRCASRSRVHQASAPPSATSPTTRSRR